MFSDGLIFIAFLLPALVSRSLAANSCKEDKYEKCIGTLQSIVEDGDFVMATNEEELVTACKSLKEALDCSNDYAKACLANGKRNEVHQVHVHASENIVKALCTKKDSPFRQEYLEHVEVCYEDIKEDIAKCDNKHVPEDFEEWSENKRNLMGCCIHFTHKTCVRDKVLAQCTLRASDFSQKIIMMTDPPNWNTTCGDFRAFDCFDLETSMEPPSPASKSSSSFAFVILSLFVLFLSQRRMLPSFPSY